MSHAQVQKHFKVDDNSKSKKISLNYASTSGICYLGPSETQESIAVYSNRDIDEFHHSFSHELHGANYAISLKLEDKNTESFSQSISSKVFSQTNSENNVWKIYLTKNKPYDIDLEYGIGQAIIDLSGLSVSSFKVNTGSADINLGYMSDIPNQIEMESFHVTVDLGNVVVRKLNMARAKNIVAELSFGNMLLDMTEKPSRKTNIMASVGAGNLEIFVPKNDCPTMVRIKNSMFCDVKLTKSFIEIDDNIFVNHTGDDENLLVFDVDVSVGNIVFKEKK